MFVYRNVFCKGANVGLGHREEGEAASLQTKKVFLASPGWWDLVHPDKLPSPHKQGLFGRAVGLP